MPPDEAAATATHSSRGNLNEIYEKREKKLPTHRLQQQQQQQRKLHVACVVVVVSPVPVDLGWGAPLVASRNPCMVHRQRQRQRQRQSGNGS